ncbi:MAG: hypothetical protein Q4G21_10320 [Dermabacter sp.]|nr:hypothetical protein [Dermabacter sp.]
MVPEQYRGFDPADYLSDIEDDRRAIQETLFLMSAPRFAESIREARAEGVEAGSTDLDW